MPSPCSAAAAIVLSIRYGSAGPLRAINDGRWSSFVAKGNWAGPHRSATLIRLLTREQAMTSEFDSATPASRRNVIAAAMTMAAAGAASSGGAQAQNPSNLRFSNPPGMSTPPTYSHVVEVNGPHRTIYLAGQTGVDATGKVAEGFRAQAVQVMENIKTALASVGGGFEHIVKLTSYLTNLEANAAEFREIRGSYFPNKQALPASTLLQVPRLANPAFLLEVEAIAVLPPKA
jgi:enamine deaminase RidA (YjgF/YER057c/UK114 family)